MKGSVSFSGWSQGLPITTNFICRLPSLVLTLRVSTRMKSCVSHTQGQQQKYVNPVTEPPPTSGSRIRYVVRACGWTGDPETAQKPENMYSSLDGAICDALTGLMVFISVGTTNAVSTACASGDMASAKRVASVSVIASFTIGVVVAATPSLRARVEAYQPAASVNFHAQ